jgi:FkbM family methyltransferase
MRGEPSTTLKEMRGKLVVFLGHAARAARRVGLGRVVRELADALDLILLRTKVPPLIATIDGMSIRGYFRHRSFLAYVEGGMTEEHFYRSLVRDAIDPGATFVDGGAHIGVYTLLACKRAQRVVAFEPDPYNLVALQANVASSKCGNVEIHAAALADRCGVAAFRAFRSTISSSLIPRDVGKYRKLDIQVRTLDDVLDGSAVDNLVIKLDLEGAEPLALLGMRKTIARAGNLTIFVEINPAALQAGGSSIELLLATLRSARLECAVVDERRQRVVPIAKARPLRKGNLICRKTFEGGNGALLSDEPTEALLN